MTDAIKELARDIAARIGVACTVIINRGFTPSVSRIKTTTLTTYEISVGDIIVHRVIADHGGGRGDILSIHDIDGLRSLGLHDMADRAEARREARGA